MTAISTIGSPELSELVRRDRWRSSAACKDSDLAFLDADDNPAACLRVCRRCTVRAQCAETALRFPSQVGVMGGTTGPQREWLRRNQRTATKVATTCRALGIDVDELSDWHAAAGPETLNFADRALDADSAAAKHGVSLRVLHSWLDARGATPGKAPKRRGRYKEAGPWFEMIRDFLKIVAVEKPGEWIDQTELADHLARTLNESLIRDTPYFEKRGVRSTWTRYAHNVVESGVRDGWMEQRPHPTAKRRRQVRYATAP